MHKNINMLFELWTGLWSFDWPVFLIVAYLFIYNLGKIRGRKEIFLELAQSKNVDEIS